MKRCRPLLGTLIEVSLCDRLGNDDGNRVIDVAFGAIERVDRLMSFHRPDSDLSRLNTAAPGQLVELDPWTVEVLALSLELTLLTDGLFDCDVGEQLVQWGLLPQPPARASIGPADVHVSSIALEIVDERTVRVRRPLCFDLGGIAKGYAVDKAIEALAACGVTQAVVNAGGDLRVLGDEPAVIHIRRADGSGTMVKLGELADGALATSSNEMSGHWTGGIWCSALVNPLTRAAVDGDRSYSVFAPRCAVADGLTKVLAIAGHLNQRCVDRYGAVPVVL